MFPVPGFAATGPMMNPRKFGELLSTFEKIHLPTVSDNTRIRYELDIERRIRPHFQSFAISKVSPLKVEAFRSQIQSELAPKSVNNCTALLSLVFNKGVEWGMVEKSPVTIRNLRIPEIKYTWWDRKEHITKFLKRARRSPNYAAYLLALECGLRLGEIVGLSKKDIDLKRCQIHIHRQWLEAQRRFGPPKGNKQRFIRFSPQSELRRELAAAIKRSPHPEAIFVSTTGRRIHPTKLRAKEFPELLRLTQVPKIRFHDLRHTFASWYMLAHDNIWDLKDILGHGDVQTTQRYAHLSRRHLKAGTLNLSRR
jgi:integrase